LDRRRLYTGECNGGRADCRRVKNDGEVPRWGRVRVLAVLANGLLRRLVGHADNKRPQFVDSPEEVAAKCAALKAI
jgi:hypothetical protein